MAHLVPFAWNGGIGTLFAYGQTGSGKTFTVSRLQQLVAGSLTDDSLEGQRQIYISIIDLAGNSAYDLLNSRKPVSILEDSFGVTQWTGASEYQVQGRNEVVDVIERAASFRRTAPTLKNDASSRSHSICRIRIEDQSMDDSADGLLYLIDLAGSEAARDVAIHGADRMRETREINMSLSVLKDCILGKVQLDALIRGGGGPKSKQQKKPHIPFRRSALTRVLKHVFDPAGGRACKTVVVACVNPSLADIASSKNTLRYAEMLRVLVPAPADPGAESTTEPNTTTMPGRLALTSRLTSSRDLLDPTAMAVPFKERIRPGMVVSWKPQPPPPPPPPPPGRCLTRRRSMPPDDDLKLAVVLCPAIEVVQQGTAIPGILGNNVMSSTEESDEHTSTREDNGTGGGGGGAQRFLCALVTPAPAPEAYELNLWQQIVIDVGRMDKEVFLEYDAGTRYYYISV